MSIGTRVASRLPLRNLCVFLVVSLLTVFAPVVAFAADTGASRLNPETAVTGDGTGPALIVSQEGTGSYILAVVDTDSDPNTYTPGAVVFELTNAGVVELQSIGGAASAEFFTIGTLAAFGEWVNVTTTQRDALTPREGFQVFNDTTKEFQGYDGKAWVTFATPATYDGDNVVFDDADGKFIATNVDDALSELDDANASGPNAADGKVEWDQIVGMPAGFVDGTDDGTSTNIIVQENDTTVTAVLAVLDFLGAHFDVGDVSGEANVSLAAAVLIEGDALTGTDATFSDPDGNFTATDLDAAVAELDDVNGSGPNAADGKVEWSQLVGVPPTIADGVDDGGAGGSGIGVEEGDVVVDASLLRLDFAAAHFIVTADGGDELDIALETAVLIEGDALNDDDVAVDDADGVYTAVTLGAILEELNDSLAGGPNNGGPLHWSRLVGVPAGIADGIDDTVGAGAVLTMTEQGSTPSTPAAGDAKLYFDNANPPVLRQVDDTGTPAPVALRYTKNPSASILAIWASGASRVSATPATALIAGTPSGSDILIDTETNPNQWDMVERGQLGSFAIRNVTQSEIAWIANGGFARSTGTVTLTAAVPGTWADNDVLDLATAATINALLGANGLTLDLSQTVTANTVLAQAQMFCNDTGTTPTGAHATLADPDSGSVFGACKAWAASSNSDTTPFAMPLDTASISGKYLLFYYYLASGTNTMSGGVRLFGWYDQ